MKHKTDRLNLKRAAFVERTGAALAVDHQTAISMLSIGRVQSVRVNPLKANTHVLEEMLALGWTGKPYPWYPDGYSIETGLTELRDSELAATGQIYIQNAASWLPILALDPRPDETVLDVCAAPGGKTSHIAALAQNRANITANDNSRPRLAKLRANLERLGVHGVTYTLFDATQIARKIEDQQFDKILLDAPCSGEGMMNYQSDKDMSTWSVAQIKRLQQQQKRLITQAWQLLRPGGTLVYSTCTIAPEENEAVIDYLLRSREDAQLEPIAVEGVDRWQPVLAWHDRKFSQEMKHVIRLAPSQQTEAFFVARIRKLGGS